MVIAVFLGVKEKVPCEEGEEELERYAEVLTEGKANAFCSEVGIAFHGLACLEGILFYVLKITKESVSLPLEKFFVLVVNEKFYVLEVAMEMVFF